jgi:pyruvate,orthophosphate dikinase
MIPLVGDVRELTDQKKIVVRVAEAVMKERGVRVKYLVGTNDLTQLTYGFSRDDIGKFLGAYQEKRILARDPFASLDIEGVGQLVAMGTTKGRQTKPNLKVGVCGEHGGDPASIHFFDAVGLDYVSCSPYRVPVARLAAAQAALKQKAGD